MEASATQSLFCHPSGWKTALWPISNAQYRLCNRNREEEVENFNTKLYNCMSSAYCFGCDVTAIPPPEKFSNGHLVAYKDLSSYCMCWMKQTSLFSTGQGDLRFSNNNANRKPSFDSKTEKMVYGNDPNQRKHESCCCNQAQSARPDVNESFLKQPSVVSFNTKRHENDSEHELSQPNHCNTKMRHLNYDGDGDLEQKEKFKFTMRSDVVKKTILRSFKKFFINEFKAYYNYTKRIRRKHYNISSKAFKEAKEFITSTLPEFEHIENIHMFLIAIVDTKRKYNHHNPLFGEVRAEILNMLKMFNCEKFDKLLQYPQIAALFTKFLRSPINEICREKQDPTVISAYQKQVNSIVYRCSATLSKSI